MIKLLAGIFLVGMITSDPVPESSSKMDEFSWLLGNWEMPKKNRMMLETWEQTNDSTYSESSWLVRENGEKVLLEKVQLVFRENEFWYIPEVSDENLFQPVKFRIISHSNKKFIAENRTHDFPKQIIYEKTGEDTFHAQINDGVNPPVKKTDFYYSRKEN